MKNPLYTCESCRVYTKKPICPKCKQETKEFLEEQFPPDKGEEAGNSSNPYMPSPIIKEGNDLLKGILGGATLAGTSYGVLNYSGPMAKKMKMQSAEDIQLALQAEQERRNKILGLMPQMPKEASSMPLCFLFALSRL